MPSCSHRAERWKNAVKRFWIWHIFLFYCKVCKDMWGALWVDVILRCESLSRAHTRVGPNTGSGRLRWSRVTSQTWQRAQLELNLISADAVCDLKTRNTYSTNKCSNSVSVLFVVGWRFCSFLIDFFSFRFCHFVSLNPLAIHIFSHFSLVWPQLQLESCCVFISLNYSLPDC